MLYIPGKLLIVHIPRTGGNSLIRTVAKAALGDYDVTINTDGNSTSGTHRHSTADEIRNWCPDFHKILKVATYRPTQDIIYSDYVMSRDLPQHKGQTLEQFTKSRWVPWLAGKTAWQHWSGGHCEKLMFTDLDKACHRIMSHLDLPATSLPKLDWQKQQYKNINAYV